MVKPKAVLIMKLQREWDLPEAKMKSIRTDGTITLAYMEDEVRALMAIKNEAPNSSVKNKFSRK